MTSLSKILSQKIFQNIKRLLTSLRRLASNRAPSDVLYQIIDMNPKRLTVVIRCMKTPHIFKDKISSAIRDSDIISGFAAIEACWLGYYYGSAFKNASNKKIQELTNKMNVLLKKNQGKYKIYALNRDGRLAYIDIETNTSYEESPLIIAQNESIISQFDPSQACYIGILSGLETRNSTDSKNHALKPNLRLVK